MPTLRAQFEHLGLRVAFRAKPHSIHRRLAALVVMSAAVVSCDKPSPDNSTSNATNTATQLPNVSSAAPSSSGKTPAPAPAPSASAAADNAADSVFVGTWEGRYDAKKGDVGMPARLEDKVRRKDDGKTAIGAGNVTIVVNKSLEIDGSADGALGASKIRGKVDAEEIRASFDPADVLDKQGMYGIISGQRNGDKIEALIRVANGDATIVREAAVVLKKKP